MKNQKQKLQLGMNPGNASQKLCRMLLFDFVQKAGLDNCFRCGKKIESVRDFSIEHIKPWIDSDDPKGHYFDLTNITFSHLKCNCGAARQNKRIIPPPGMKYCYDCRSTKKQEEFAPRAKPASQCRDCNTKYKQRYKNEG